MRVRFTKEYRVCHDENGIVPQTHQPGDELNVPDHVAKWALADGAAVSLEDDGENEDGDGEFAGVDKPIETVENEDGVKRSLESKDDEVVEEVLDAGASKDDGEAIEEVAGEDDLPRSARGAKASARPIDNKAGRGGPENKGGR